MTMFEDIIYIFRFFIIVAASLVTLTYTAAYLDGYFHEKAVHAKDHQLMVQ
jgi:hypothetical protein